MSGTDLVAPLPLTFSQTQPIILRSQFILRIRRPFPFRPMHIKSTKRNHTRTRTHNPLPPLTPSLPERPRSISPSPCNHSHPSPWKNYPSRPLSKQVHSARRTRTRLFHRSPCEEYTPSRPDRFSASLVQMPWEVLKKDGKRAPATAMYVCARAIPEEEKCCTRCCRWCPGGRVR
jgi:hypothetical protein